VKFSPYPTASTQWLSLALGPVDKSLFQYNINIESIFLVTVKILLTLSFTIGVTFNMSITLEFFQTVVEVVLSLTVTVNIKLALAIEFLGFFLYQKSFNGKSHEVGLDINCLPSIKYAR